jgi:hypothetical protein
MIALLRGFNCLRSAIALCAVAALHFALLQDSASAIQIIIDYRYDTNNFFNSQVKKNALQAAANRYSAVITSSLAAVNLVDNNEDPRIGFTHPATGNLYRVSSAASAASDIVIPVMSQQAADEYRAWSLGANQWILFAGGRDMDAQGVGGQISVVNMASVFDTPASIVNRNFRTSGSTANLPVWGGSISFDTAGTNWHFDHTTPVPNGVSAVDFYSVALHEIGHALGLNKNYVEWTSHIAPFTRQFRGQAVDAYNADNGTSLAALNIEAAAPSLNPHWDEGAYNSYIFRNGGPNYVDTVGSDGLQDVLMETFLAFGSRFDLTHVDVAALRDVGWMTLPQTVFQPGDFNGNGIVNAADYILLRKGLTTGTEAVWRANYGESLAPAITADAPRVPEPPTVSILALASVVFLASRRKNTDNRG